MKSTKKSQIQCIVRKGKANLARAILDDDMAILTDGAGLLRESLGGAGVGLVLESVLGVRHDHDRSTDDDRARSHTPHTHTHR